MHETGGGVRQNGGRCGVAREVEGVKQQGIGHDVVVRSVAVL